MTHDEMIAVIQADRDGKKVQCRHRTAPDNPGWETFNRTSPGDRPGWNFSAFDYRVAPEPVPPGDLTWDEAKRLHESGVKVDFLRPGGTHREWFTVDAWFDNATEGEIKSAAYRRTPAPRMVELEWTDIKPTDLFRLRGGGPGWQLPVGVSPNGVWFASNESFPLKFWPFSQMRLEVERSQDASATWARCEKPAREEGQP